MSAVGEKKPKMTSAHPEDRLVSCSYSIPPFRARVGAAFPKQTKNRRRDVSAASPAAATPDTQSTCALLPQKQCR